jgi:competence protein ComEA
MGFAFRAPMVNLRVLSSPASRGLVALVAGLSKFWRGLNQLRRRVALWVWAPVVGKMLLWCGAFIALAYVGSGATARLLGARGASTTDRYASHGQALFARDGFAAVASTKLGNPLAAQGCRPQDGGAPTDGQAPKKPPKAVTAEGKVILNLATEKDLVKLPGIGAKRARAIRVLRDRLGRFSRLTDLLRVRGIGYRLLRRLRPLVVLDAPKS